ncbi:PTS transporter subunit EIIC [Nigerium massiliense]|uniref:PTS transporter subunit EIIC n=1 Tax=Nigerium massiliense TaxID=1522317 RepID=UPI00058E8917|nr:PTS transporter subunit EIIC [Nigerium massiliense]
MTQSKELAEQITQRLGGSDNVLDVENCITRLRIGVRDLDAVDVDGLKAIDDVLGVVADDTMQVVLGPGKVDDVARLMSAAGVATVSHSAAEDLSQRGEGIRAENKARNQTPLKIFLRRIANIFLPLIPALIACGIIAGINGIFVNLATNGTAPWAAAWTPALAAIASGFMSLISVFVGMNTAKEFGGTPVLGGAVAAIIPFAGVAKVSILGNTLAPGQGGVIGALLAAVIAAYVERWTRRWAPQSLSMLIVPTVTVLVAGGLTLFPIMTVAGAVSTAIGVAANWLLGTGGALAGFVLAGLFLPLVMMGLHQALIPIHTTLIQQTGYTILLPVLAMAGAGQVGAAIAILVKARRSPSMRKAISSALPAGLLGVGEPLIYGVTLPLGRPFITACVGGAFGGGFIGLFSQLGTTVGSTAIGPSGWALFPLVNGSQGIGPAVGVYAGGLLVGYVAGFLATYFLGLPPAVMAEIADNDDKVTRETHLAAAPDAGEGTRASSARGEIKEVADRG